MTVLKLTQIGDSIGVILPNEILARMKLRAGDTIFWKDAASGGVTLTPYDPEFELQMESVRQIMKEWRDVPGESAK